MRKSKLTAVFFALLAAVFYALNAPASKLLLSNVSPTMMAALLYLGAGLGIGILSSAGGGKKQNKEKLTRSDLPYVIGMVVLDIAAPILLMFGLSLSNAATVSLLNNFEIVATVVIALFIFKERVSGRLWIGIVLITVACIMLSVGDFSELRFSIGSTFVLLACVCWGFENNCTRRISGKDTFEIVFIKGIFSGSGSLAVAFAIGESFPEIRYVIPALILGFVAYGLSIFFYIKAQNVIGAAKTSTYYAAAPFIGALLSHVFLKEPLTGTYSLALIIMVAGSAVVVMDTLIIQHRHLHTHVIRHTHDGSTHTHVVTHSHEHTHVLTEGVHHHHHTEEELLGREHRG